MKETRGQRVIRFIEKYCRVPEGKLIGKPIRLLDFQKKFILEVYDNPHRTTRAYLSIARKNGKSALIACIALAHVAGPEARMNSQVVSGARSKNQASIIFSLMSKMILMNPDLKARCHVVRSAKTILGKRKNVEFQALSADGDTAHGLSPILAILDEVGQVRGAEDPFIEAIETSQGAYEGRALIIAISTQARTNNDLWSRWIDDALGGNDPSIVAHVYTAPERAELDDPAAWRAANPALGVFRSLQDIEDGAARAKRMPSFANSFRWLFLNQRIEGGSPFVSRDVWMKNSGELCDMRKIPVYGGLDLSSTTDLTSLVLIGKFDRKWHVQPYFWLPADDLHDRDLRDRAPYTEWVDSGHLLVSPGNSVDYDFIAEYLKTVFDQYDVQKIAFDRWNFKHFLPSLRRAEFTDAQIDKFVEFGQGYASMSPAIRVLESELVNYRVVHPNNPVLNMCAASAVITEDASGNRKLDKKRSSRRIDGMVALTMAFGALPAPEKAENLLTSEKILARKDLF